MEQNKTSMKKKLPPELLTATDLLNSTAVHQFVKNTDDTRNTMDKLKKTEHIRYKNIIINSVQAAMNKINKKRK